MITVVLDTNIVVSAFLNEDGLEAAVLDLALNRRLSLILSEPILDEYTRVLHRRKLGLDPKKINHALTQIRHIARMVKPTKAVSASKDDPDNRFLECAEASSADFLVTGNTRHFPKEWKTTSVVTARQLIEGIVLNLRREKDM
ncbi:MAG: putative toxin-antitoxin system toxin component, PIN family [Acidobacteriia bacterium]|nr:putative toxin-antitoxin system toxin component, PIN family [Terriglobia bacterium]